MRNRALGIGAKMCDGTPVGFVVRRATPTDASAILPVLERSLSDDPLVRWLARAKPRAVRSYLVLMLERIAFPRGIVHVALDGPRAIGAALWAPPHTFELSARESLM